MDDDRRVITTSAAGFLSGGGESDDGGATARRAARARATRAPPRAAAPRPSDDVGDDRRVITTSAAGFLSGGGESDDGGAAARRAARAGDRAAAAARAAGVALDDLIDRAMSAPAPGSPTAGLRPADSWAKLRATPSVDAARAAGEGRALTSVTSGVPFDPPSPPPPPPIRTGVRNAIATIAARGSPRGVGAPTTPATAATTPTATALRRLHSVGGGAYPAPRLGAATPAAALPDHPLAPRRDSFLSALARPLSASLTPPRVTTTTTPTTGEPVLLYFGIIDFLQAYNARKAAEHAVKTVAYGRGDAMSVVNPHAYAARFMAVMERLFVED